MESSNTSELASDSAMLETASPAEVNQPDIVNEDDGSTEAAAETKVAIGKEPTLQEKILALKDKPVKGEAGHSKSAAPEKPEVPVKEGSHPVVPEKPVYQANYSYKAFGKEKQLPEEFRSLIKDADSEKRVKEVFTRADAFDDMKSRYENVSFEAQKINQNFSALDRDVKRVTSFLNKGDLKNFFTSVGLTNDKVLGYLQQEAQIASLSPQQQQQYAEAAQLRQQQYDYQEQMNQMQANYANQAVQTRTMQLDMVLGRPDVSSAANAWDSKMGPGSFRSLVAEEAARHWYATKQDLSAADATQMVLNKYGKLLESPQPQAQAAPIAAQPQSQAAQPVVNAKPVIPAVQGRGASPIKQAPRNLDDLKKMAAKYRQSEPYEETF